MKAIFFDDKENNIYLVDFDDDLTIRSTEPLRDLRNNPCYYPKGQFLEFKIKSHKLKKIDKKQKKFLNNYWR